MRVFQQYITQQGLKNTPQRQRIVGVFLSATGHASAEEIYTKAKTLDKSLGQATVYRTIKLLCDSGLAREVHFGDGVCRYERRDTSHHDHLICEHCGKTIEVLDDTIEKLQEDLAKKHGFLPTSHQLYLYGVCSNCQKSLKY